MENNNGVYQNKGSEKEKSDGTMKVYQKWEDLAMTLYEGLRSYPKSEKFTLASKTTDTILEIGVDFMQANVIQDRTEKRRLIQHADRQLVRLKLLVRMGMLLKYLDLKKWERFVGQVTEIGKMVGGWLKSINGNSNGV